MASEKWKDMKMLAILYNNRILLKTFSFKQPCLSINLNTQVYKGIDKLGQIKEHPLKRCS